MSFIQNNIWLIIGMLLVLIIVEGLIIYIQYYFQNENKNNFSRYVPIEKHKQILEERDNYRNKFNKLNAEKGSGIDSRFELNYKNICKEKGKLEQEIEKLKNEKKDLEQKVRDLNRDKNELSRIIGYGTGPKPPVIHNSDYPTYDTPISEANEESMSDNQQDSSQPSTQDSVSEELGGDKNVHIENSQVDSFKGITMYASFPRLAGNSVYFSDLSEKLADDSYFELKVSTVLGKATFKPIDFMKIRNYDEAMAAMRTEGAKPNVATTVLDINWGDAHKEGKDWIISNFATIKLA